MNVNWLTPKFVAVAAILFSGAWLASPVFAGEGGVGENARIAQYWDTCGQMGWSEVESFETEEFYVNICSDGDALYFVGEPKVGTDIIDLPVVERTETGYVAENDNSRYVLDRQRLVIRQGDNPIEGDRPF